MTGPRWRSGDGGHVSLLVAVLALAVLLSIGFAVDGAGKMRAIERADAMAGEAARAATQAIDVGQAQSGGPKVVDPADAVMAALGYLDAAGATGTAQIGRDGQTVEVTVTLVYDTTFLGIIGIGQMTVTRTASALLLTG